MLGLVQRHAGVVARSLHEALPLELARLRVVAPGYLEPPSRLLDLTELRQRIGRRRIAELVAQGRDRRSQLAAAGLKQCEPRDRSAVRGINGERRAVAPLRGGVAPTGRGQVRAQGANVGGSLDRSGPRRDGRVERPSGSPQVAVELAVVGHARVGGEGRLQANHPLQRPRGCVVATGLDQAVDERGVGGDERRLGTVCLPRQDEPVREPVLGERDVAWPEIAATLPGSAASASS